MPSRILIVVPSLYWFDAIGTDVILQYECLKEGQKDVAIYAEQFEPKLQELVISHSSYLAYLADPKALIIYHFGVFWRGLPQLLSETRATLWIKYHNVTPPTFFAGWDLGSFHATAAGLDQAKWLTGQSKVDLYIGDSEFNLRELSQLSGRTLSREAVHAPMIRWIEHPTGDAEAKPLELAKDCIHVLFVGRVVPNKGHRHLLGTVRAFRDFFPDTPIKLHIAGASSPSFQAYHDFLVELCQAAAISDFVHFWGKTSAQTLKNLYRQATVFLCMSEHEGFCVPVIEAQQEGLPVLALARGAVPGTLGPEQVLMEGEVDYDLAACLIKDIADDAGFRQHLIDNGLQNAARFSKQTLQTQFLQLINSLH